MASLMRDPGIMPGNLEMKMKTSLICGGIVYHPDTQLASSAMLTIPGALAKETALRFNCDIINGGKLKSKKKTSCLDEIQQPNDSLILIHFLISCVNEQFD